MRSAPSLLQGMLPFHNHFRHAHSQLMQGLPQSQSTSRFNLQTMMQQSLQLCHSLEMHHTIEETYIFPLLAKKMPSFGTEDPVHIREHQAMHEKLEELQSYSNKALKQLQSGVGKRLEAEGCGKAAEEGEGERKAWPTGVYDADTFEALVRALGLALFPHLEAEEKSLRASNLKEHGLTLQDLGQIPM